MRILIVSPFYPLPIRSGGHSRIFNLIRYTGQRHNVQLLSLITPDLYRFPEALEGVKEPAVLVLARNNDTFGQRLAEAMLPWKWLRTIRRLQERIVGLPRQASRFYFPPLAQHLKRLLTKYHFDVVQLEYTAMGRYLPLIRRYAPDVRIVLDEIDISYIALQRLAEQSNDRQKKFLQREIIRMRQFEHSLWSQCDAMITPSEVDEQHIQEYASPEKVWVVPNGVDTEYFSFHPCETNNHSILFLGYFRHPPNVIGLRFFIQEVLPQIRKHLPDVRLEVVGDAVPEDIKRLHSKDGITIHGYVKDVRAFMHQCRAMVVPIFNGGGTRLKVLEAFSAGLPVVSTVLGCEGIDIQSEQELLLANTSQEFTRALCSLLENDSLAYSLAKRARQLVETKYSWKTLSQQLEEVWIYG
ncbi:MAG: glycosyltransferase family 4 protein [bacterium]